MKFNVFIPNETILMAARLVERHYRDDGFLAMVIAHKGFNMTKDSPTKVAGTILMSNITMDVREYKTRLPWSRVIGYAKKLTIWCNSRKFDLPLKERVQNFMHEPLHLLGYKHDGNKNTEFNRGTVPYKVAEIFVEYLVKIGKLPQ